MKYRIQNFFPFKSDIKNYIEENGLWQLFYMYFSWCSNIVYQPAGEDIKS